MTTAVLSLTFIVPVVWLMYTLKARWVARAEWTQYSPDTKAFYLLVAPPITFALDVLMVTDRLFYRPGALPLKRANGNSGAGKAVLCAALLSMASEVAVAHEIVASPDVTHAQDEQQMKKPAQQDHRQPYLSPAEAAAVQYRQTPDDSSTAEDVTSEDAIP